MATRDGTLRAARCTIFLSLSGLGEGTWGEAHTSHTHTSHTHIHVQCHVLYGYTHTHTHTHTHTQLHTLYILTMRALVMVKSGAICEG